MVALTFLVASLVAPAIAAASALTLGPRPGQIKNLVTFGDSYTDITLLWDGGSGPSTAWPVYAARDGHLNLNSFARTGAACSNNITWRPWPSLFEAELPEFFAANANGSLKALKPQDTIFTLWLGTNDIGANALFTGNGTKGATIVDTVGCAVNFINVLYKSGWRNFLFQNMLPLDKTVLYSVDSYPNLYWTLQRNTTEWNLMMKELSTAGNEIAKLMLQLLPASTPGAHIGLFDSHGLFTDMAAHPERYLNGTAPLNTTAAIRSCVYPEGADPLNKTLATCTEVKGTDVDSYLWFDELHPSEQADRVVAREIAAAINRKSSNWTTWYS
ncbi:hypothetical protein EIP91_010201 [Steccherinum ochraceum]|uniref:SGNH hydrolase-type esterase domain-containing protein n=1 Tax=Steccherinum ochraceum TaxID=92696 RepID=A0A4R0RMW3_9APHY|nr:hypothetical protein EIP91_000232 [Steccherinum ochraceum]TCD68679.1 hypothetical protein EIP91_010201 [Steccherinum ochraceum]